MVSQQSPYVVKLGKNVATSLSVNVKLTGEHLNFTCVRIKINNFKRKKNVCHVSGFLIILELASLQQRTIRMVSVS